MHHHLAFDAVNQVTFFPGKVVMVFDVQQHVQTEVTGDMTVETSSTNQQLKTQYSGRVGQHADLGGEINRDEIPLVYRDYVREYMQLVHKQAEKQQ